jgi:hypothetical protein
MFIVIWQRNAAECWSEFVDFVTAARLQGHLSLQGVACEILVATKAIRDKIAATPKVQHGATNMLLMPVTIGAMVPLKHHVLCFSKQ